MVTRFQGLFLAGVVILMIALGTLGIYAAEASSLRAATSGQPIYTEIAPAGAYGLSDVTSEISPIPGLSY